MMAKPRACYHCEHCFTIPPLTCERPMWESRDDVTGEVFLVDRLCTEERSVPWWAKEIKVPWSSRTFAIPHGRCGPEGRFWKARPDEFFTNKET